MQQPKRSSQPAESIPSVATQASRAGINRSVSAGTTSPSTPAPSTQWASQKPVDPHRSLYNMSVTVLSKLQQMGSLHAYISACSYTDEATNGMPRINLGIAPFGGKIDPVSQLWRVLRLGAPLCEILNVLNPSSNLEVLPPPQCTDIRTVKRLLYRFLQACLGPDLKPDLEDSLFTISNVFSDSTSDLLKVIKTVQLILNLLVERNILNQIPLPPLVELPSPQTQRDRVVNELIQTERKYVQDLELMGDYSDAMLAANVPRETVQKIFPYLTRLVDFQRRFLVGLEYHARLPPDQQQFGSLFEIMRDEFQVYEGYTLNQREAVEIATAEVANLEQFSDILEPHYELPNMLLKPIQRISKYPLLLRELIKNTPHEWAPYQTLVNGLEIMQEIMQTVNETQRKVDCRYVFSELRERVKSWHDISIDLLGELLLSGVYPVIERESENEYHLYLFENILLCCKGNTPAKKGSLKIRASRASSQSKRNSLDLKGRLYLSAVVSTSVTKDPNGGGHILSIIWGRGDAQETGHFDIRLQNEEQCNLWDNAIKKLVGSRRLDGGMPTAYDDNDPSPFYDDIKSTISSPIDTSPFRKLSIGSNAESRRNSGLSSSTATLNSTYAARISNPMPPGLHHTYSESTLHTLHQQPLGSARSEHMASSTPTTPIHSGPNVKVRIFYQVDSFVLLVDKNIAYAKFLAKVERKIRLCGKTAPSPLRIKYKDEDDDYVTLSSDEDLFMAFECSMGVELSLLVSG